MLSDQTALTPQRSTFVTVLAWIFIVGGGFATFISLLQALMFAFVFPHDAFTAIDQSRGFGQMPAIWQFMFRNFLYLFMLFWMLAASTLISSIGLLRRKNWGRCIFIGIMAFAIFWNICGLGLQYLMMSSFPMAPTEGAEGFKVMTTVMLAATGLLAIAISVLCGWIIKRLLSPKIAEEFRRG